MSEPVGTRTGSCDRLVMTLGGGTAGMSPFGVRLDVLFPGGLTAVSCTVVLGPVR